MSQLYKFKFNEYIYPVKLNWPQIIDDIILTGRSYSDIANLVGVPWSTAQRWRDGSEPMESSGRSLLALHCRCCGEDLTIQRIAESGGLKQIQYLVKLFQKAFSNDA